MNSLFRFLKIDRFLLLLIAAIVLASVWPTQGMVKVFLHNLTIAAIALLFFTHGAKLSRQALFSGLIHWRLHLLIFASTFVLFPLIGLSLQWLPERLMPPGIYAGFLYLCILPATIQSAIAFTSIAHGNVAAAVCSASSSSLIGVFVSPLLAAWFIRAEGEQHLLASISTILLQLLLPFILGHFSRPLIGGWMMHHHRLVRVMDQSSILLVVYLAFSEAVSNGIWQQLTWNTLGIITLISSILLAVVVCFNTQMARHLGFNKEDEITIVFCGSKKSLATGVPMANILFPSTTVGIMLLPLMIFHQIQLMVCAVMAQRYAVRESILPTKE